MLVFVGRSGRWQHERDGGCDCADEKDGFIHGSLRSKVLAERSQPSVVEKY
jgi:uncharacterized protein (DUF952 family)